MDGLVDKFTFFIEFWITLTAPGCLQLIHLLCASVTSKITLNRIEDSVNYVTSSHSLMTEIKMKDRIKIMVQYLLNHSILASFWGYIWLTDLFTQRSILVRKVSKTITSKHLLYIWQLTWRKDLTLNIAIAATFKTFCYWGYTFMSSVEIQLQHQIIFEKNVMPTQWSFKAAADSWF